MTNRAKLYKTYHPSDRKIARALDALMKAQHAHPYVNDQCGSCREVHSGSCAIPDASYYVCSNDSFMSGWGLAKNTINVCVVPCANWDEARKVQEYVESRTDQKYIRIVGEKPRPRGRKLSLLLAWRYHGLKVEIDRVIGGR